MEKTTLDLLNTTNAQEWAQEFMRLFGDKKEKIDEGLMIAWFANAIETGRSHAKREGNKFLEHLHDQ